MLREFADTTLAKDWKKMLSRVFIALAVVAIASTQLRAEHAAVAKVGDQIVLRMTGKLAVEYARRTGSGPEVTAADGLYVQTTATVVQELGDDRIRIAHSSHINRNGDEAHLVTLRATVDQKTIDLDATTLRLNLSNFKGVKLRSWKLVDEIGG